MSIKKARVAAKHVQRLVKRITAHTNDTKVASAVLEAQDKVAELLTFIDLADAELRHPKPSKPKAKPKAKKRR